MDSSNKATDEGNSQPITLAVSATKSAIESRAQGHRNLVVAVVVVVFASLVLGLFYWPWMPGMGLGVLIAVCGLFFWIDLRRIRHWQETIVTLCIDRELPFDVLTRVLASDKRVPPTTVSAMLLSVRSLVQVTNQDPTSEPKSQSALHQLKSLSRRNETRTLLGAASAACAAMALVWLLVHPSVLAATFAVVCVGFVIASHKLL